MIVKTTHVIFQLNYLTLILFALSCENSQKENSISPKPDTLTTEFTKTDPPEEDTVLVFTVDSNFTNHNISNSSDRKIDLLFNGVKNYFGGQPKPVIDFRTECLSCEKFQEYSGGLLFAKRLLITHDEIRFYKTDLNIPDNQNVILRSDFRQRKNPKFQFSQGNGNFKFIGASCNDADFNEVQLTFPTGKIIIDSLLNASFLEYDINKDGLPEQYILGARNCSQELVILRIRKP